MNDALHAALRIGDEQGRDLSLLHHLQGRRGEPARHSAVPRPTDIPREMTELPRFTMRDGVLRAGSDA